MAEKPDLEDYEEVESKLSRMNLDDDQDRPEIPVDVEMLTWNTNFSAGETKFASIRDILISIVKAEPTTHCITFLQEVKIDAPSVR